MNLFERIFERLGVVQDPPGKHEIEAVRFQRQLFDVAPDNVDIEALRSGIFPGQIDGCLRQVHGGDMGAVLRNPRRQRAGAATDIQHLQTVELLPVHFAPEERALAEDHVLDLGQRFGRFRQPFFGFPVGIGHGLGFPPHLVPLLTDNRRVLCLLARGQERVCGASGRAVAAVAAVWFVSHSVASSVDTGSGEIKSGRSTAPSIRIHRMDIT